ncbi:MAG: hypothetical protein EAZ08_14185 [Cytophagales bacterium]|nr:MAG: hypothetical protein EAZ08_14185 [Cytophagales bacterium]
MYFDDLSVQHQAGALLQENAYYPYGLPIEPLSSYAAIKTANKALYQSKLLEEEMGLNWYYFDARYYDAQIGRFASMDPAMQFANDYNGMGGNPVMTVDPDGRVVWFAPILIGAAIGALTHTASHVIKNDGFSNWNWGNFGMSVLQGAVSGAASFGIGAGFQSLANAGHSIGTSWLAQAGAHALSSGTQSAAFGGSFLQGAASGAFGSLSGSGLKGLGVTGSGAAFLGGGLSGGFGSVLAGGDFFQGFAQGASVGLLNHWMHDNFDGGGRRKAESSDFDKWFNKLKAAATLTKNWLTGTGGDEYVFQNDAVANSFKNSRVVGQARDYWYNEVKAGRKSVSQGLTNFRGRKAWTGGNFGFKGLVAAGLDPMEQFVGSFSPSINSDGRSLTFTIKNTTSFRSLAYGIAPDWLRSTFRPGGNVTQIFIFKEPINLNRIR